MLINSGCFGVALSMAMTKMRLDDATVRSCYVNFTKLMKSMLRTHSVSRVNGHISFTAPLSRINLQERLNSNKHYFLVNNKLRKVFLLRQRSMMRSPVAQIHPFSLQMTVPWTVMKIVLSRNHNL